MGEPGLSFAGLLRQLRDRAQLTQEELAEAASLSPRSVSDLERGISRTARKDTAVLLANALGMAGPLHELFVAAARGKAPAWQVLAAVRDAPPQPPGVATASPYRGLAMFEEQDAAFFFGREATTVEVLDRMSRLLAGASLLVVSGMSGAGKSSLLRAGMLPRIRAAGLAAAPGAATWPCVLLTPTREPLDELALRVALLAGSDAAAVRRGLDTNPAGFALTARQATLAGPQSPAGNRRAPAAELVQSSRPPRLLLVVDQFEELFTQCPDEEQRRAFIMALHAAATAAPGIDQAPAALVVLGVRADFEARCADYPQLAGPVQDRYLVTSMTERQLRMAITEPAKKAGTKVDDDLVGILLTEVRNGQPGTFGAGVLPLLSHALDQAWRSRTGEAVTLADYERAGGIDGAVAASAQRVYDQLTLTQQAAARQVFLRLTATGSEGVDTADRATRAELIEGKNAVQAQDVEAVLEAFAAERLLTLAADTVELSHEALLTAWPLLRDTWLADTHADRIVRTRLHNTAAEWARHSRDPSYLYRGTLLAGAAEAASRIGTDSARYPPLSQTERDFLHASDRAHLRGAQQRRAVVALLIALVGFASATVVAIHASRQAAHERDIAVSGQLSIESGILSRIHPTISTLLSIAAWWINPSGAARHAMLAAAARPGIAVRTWHTGPVHSVVFSPDGKIVASGGPDGMVQLWEVATHRPIVSLRTGGTGPVYSVVFSPDGKTLASGSADGIRLWRVGTRWPIVGRLTGRSGPVYSVAFSQDGTLASGSADGIRLWEAVTHRPIGSPMSRYTGAVVSVAFSSDGKILASGSTDGIRLWQVATARQIGSPLTGHGGVVRSMAFGQTSILATGGADGTIQLWDVAHGRQIGVLHTRRTGAVVSVAFSPDGKTLASGSTDGTIQLWDLPTGSRIGIALRGGTGPVYSLAFSRDGRTLASGSADGIRLWGMAKIADPVPYLCALAGRPLTRAEWAHYLPQGPAYQRICP